MTLSGIISTKNSLSPGQPREVREVRATAFRRTLLFAKTILIVFNLFLTDRLNRRFLKEKLNDTTESMKLIHDLRSLLISRFGTLSDQYSKDDYLRSVLVWSSDRIFKISELVTDSSFDYLWTDMSNLNVDALGEDERSDMLGLVQSLEEFLSAHSKDIFNEKNVFKMDVTTVFKKLKEQRQGVTEPNRKPNYWQMIRLVLVGSNHGPPVFEIFNLLQKENIIYRLRIAKQILDK